MSNPSVKFYLDKKSQWRWSQSARNGQITATAGESYKTLTKCKNGYVSTLVNAIRIVGLVPSKFWVESFNNDFKAAKSKAGRGTKTIIS